MRELIFDTAKLRPQDRFDWWRTEMESKIGITTGALAAGPYWGKLRLRSMPSLSLLDFVASNNLAERLRPQIRRLEWGQYFIYREMSDGGLFELSGTEIETSRGDLILYDADGTMRARSKSAYRHHLWSIPKSILDPHLPNLPRPLVVHFPASGGVVGLVLAFIDALAGQMSGLSEANADCTADNLGRLIAIACGSGVRDHGAAIRAAKFNQLQQFVEQRLGWPDLTPERAADALGMSLRQLHKLFETSGNTFGGYVRNQRLKACRAALEVPSSADRSVTEIAFAHGFGSLPTFYRAFHAAYGIAPRDLRRAAMARART